MYGKYKRRKTGARTYRKKAYGSRSTYRRFTGFDKRRKLGIAKYPSYKTGATELKSKDTVGDSLTAGAPSLLLSNVADTAAAPFMNKMLCINGVVEGAGFWNRIGRRIRMQSVTINFQFYPGTAQLSNPVYHRILLIYDRQPNGALPADSDVLRSFNAANSGGVSYWFSGMNMNNRDRFLILKDFRFCEGDQAQASTPTVGLISTGSKNQFCWSWHVKLKGMETHYRATTSDGPIAGVADIATGSLFLMNTSTGLTGTLPEGSSRLLYQARLKFRD